MSISELLKTAFTALLANKTRTFLTMLGIVIGIASVIIMLGIGSGAQASIENSVQSLGSNLLTITAGSQRSGIVRAGAGTASTLTNQDAAAIQKDIPNISAVSSEITRNEQVVSLISNTNTTVAGITPDYSQVHNYQLQEGSFISQQNINSMAKVAVVGPDTAQTLFGIANPIGQKIKINNIMFKVIGETVSKGSTGFINSDDFVAIPLTTAQKIAFGTNNLRSIVVKADNADSLTQIQNDINSLLLTRHKITNPAQADFTIRNSADTLSTLSTVTGVLTALLASIASISLIVGGIGIMNIMIVTVTERTREIGLRKAIGARNETILSQFLIEAILLTFIGGISGVLLGVIAAYAFGSIAGQNIIVSLLSVILSCSVSIIVGVVFGLYPAIKASKLNPIEALRYE